MLKFLVPNVLIILICSAAFSQSKLWEYSAEWWVNSVVPVKDVSGNGIADVYAGASDNRIYCIEGGGSQKGTELWSTTVGGDVWQVAAILDVNNDGRNDCLAGAADNTVYCISGDPSKGGEHLWEYSIGGDAFAVAEMNDVNGDGKHECIAGSNDDNVYCISGATGQLIWSYTTGSTVKDVARVDDVNGDGVDDVLAVSLDDFVYCLSGKPNVSGSRLIWRYKAGDVRTVARIRDVDKDNINDCLSGGWNNTVHCLSGANGNLLWSFTAGASIHQITTIPDVDWDDRDEVLFGAADNKAYLLSGSNGSIFWEKQYNGDVWTVSSIPDVNQDGKADCIVGTGSDLIAVISSEPKDKGMEIWSKQFGGDLLSVAALPDVTGNGICDVVGGSNDSHVRAFEGNEMIVPVELSSFNAQVIKDDVQLQWTTASETNNYGFEVQRSCDISSFETIAFVPGYGTQAQPRSYKYDDENLQPDNYFYRLVQIDTDGQSQILDTLQVRVDQPSEFLLSAVHPNPFNAGTIISFQIPQRNDVTVTVHNIRGEYVHTLFDGPQDAGYYSMQWNGLDASGAMICSGLYVCSVKWGDSIKQVRMTLIK